MTPLPGHVYIALGICISAGSCATDVWQDAAMRTHMRPATISNQDLSDGCSKVWLSLWKGIPSSEPLSYALGANRGFPGLFAVSSSRCFLRFHAGEIRGRRKCTCVLPVKCHRPRARARATSVRSTPSCGRETVKEGCGAGTPTTTSFSHAAQSSIAPPTTKKKKKKAEASGMLRRELSHLKRGPLKHADKNPQTPGSFVLITRGDGRVKESAKRRRGALCCLLVMTLHRRDGRCALLDSATRALPNAAGTCLYLGCLLRAALSLLTSARPACPPATRAAFCTIPAAAPRQSVPEAVAASAGDLSS
ncbi:hypothetical protein B0J12DRAFT_284071 [Macrophomina phaseolina]|uniref:Uncharacterized protein n=1 Tax=Macrophomina phaseolina TaxID=35725 RepID=A0ABQ8GN30_9PEZI|nr:hypothetical protein B0J12DRAFT_284071 [Macrophomina phaseolina]